MNSNPFELLRQMSESIDSQATTLPDSQQSTDEWRGIGFSIAGVRFIAPMAEIAEILYVPDVTKVPGVKRWVNGIANVRGRLLSVIDLEQYFGEPGGVLGHRARILASNEHELYTGFVVPELLGMQTFTQDEYTPEVEIEERFAPFTQGAYRRDDLDWKVFSLSKLVQSPEFLQVAV